MRVLEQGPGHTLSALRGGTLPKDAARWEANRTHGERLRVRSQRRRAWSATWVAARVRGEDTPSEPESSEVMMKMRLKMRLKMSKRGR
jgi:hypothetical protein